MVEPHDISTLLGSSILINCAASGFPKPQITWLKGQGIFEKLINTTHYTLFWQENRQMIINP